MIKNKKSNPEVDRNLEEELVFYRRAVREANDILTLKDNVGWTKLQKNIQEQLDKTEEELDKFEKLTADERAIKLKERKDFRWVLGVVDSVEANLPRVESALAEIEGKIESRKKRAIVN